MVSSDIPFIFASISQYATVETIEALIRDKYDETQNHLRTWRSRQSNCFYKANTIKTENRLERAQVLQLLKFCLRTYFMFDETIYEKVKSTPIGSPISGFIAEAVLQRLELQIFQHHRPKFWARYVDDTFVLIDRD
nr:unnamed protein product [Spirometra erinaceieuropaei]